MTILCRRSFLIGLGATAAAVAVHQAAAGAGEIFNSSRLALGGDFDRVELDEIFMAMRGTDLPTNTFVNYTVYRSHGSHEETIIRLSMHPLATMRWMARPEAAIIITKSLPVRLEVDPCGLHSLIGVQYSVRRKKKGKIWREESFGHDGEHYVVPGGWWRSGDYAGFSETFDVRNGEVLTHEIHALDPDDEHLLAH